MPLAVCAAVYQRPFETRHFLAELKARLRSAISRRLSGALADSVRVTLDAEGFASTLAYNPYGQLSDRALSQAKRVWDHRSRQLYAKLDEAGFTDEPDLRYSHTMSEWYKGVDGLEREVLGDSASEQGLVHHAAPVISADIIKAQFNVGLRVLCGFGWAALEDCFQAVLRELDVQPGAGCYAVLKGMQKTLAHALLGKILKTSGLLRTLHLEVTAPPRDRWQHLRRFRAPS